MSDKNDTPVGGTAPVGRQDRDAGGSSSHPPAPAAPRRRLAGAFLGHLAGKTLALGDRGEDSPIFNTGDDSIADGQIAIFFSVGIRRQFYLLTRDIFHEERLAFDFQQYTFDCLGFCEACLILIAPSGAGHS